MRRSAANRLPAVDAGHGQVHQDHVGPAAGGQQVERVVAAGGGAQLEADGLQQLHQQFAVGLLVVDHQELAARAFVAAAHRRGLEGASAPARRAAGTAWRVHAPAGTAARGTPSPAAPACWWRDQLAAHQVGQHLGDGQAQAGARRRHGCWRCAAREGLEDAAPARGRQAGPVSSISISAISRA
jgi:hypothetical protein